MRCIRCWACWRGRMPAQGRAELLEAVYGFLLLSGNAYVEAVPGDRGLPGELHVLRSDRMALVPGPDGWPVAYDYAVGGRTHRFAVSRRAEPDLPYQDASTRTDDHYGLSPVAGGGGGDRCA